MLIFVILYAVENQMIKVQLENDCTVVKFQESTRLTRAFSSEIDPAFNALLTQKEKNVIINMGSVSSIDSYGIGIVIRLAKIMLNNNKNVAFSDFSGQVLNQVKKLGLDRVFTIYKTENEALSSMPH